MSLAKAQRAFPSLALMSLWAPLSYELKWFAIDSIWPYRCRIDAHHLCFGGANIEPGLLAMPTQSACLILQMVVSEGENCLVISDV